MKVELSESSEEWPAVFEREKERLLQAVGRLVVQLEHIGSTSVPGLIAKPVIDIQAGVASLQAFEEADGIALLQQIGYEYLPQFGEKAPFRRLFTRTEDKRRLNNLHLVAIDHPWWRRHILFRDYLRQNVQARDRYSCVKQDLAKREWPEVNDYAGAKTGVVLELEEQAFDYFEIPDDERAWIRTSRI